MTNLEFEIAASASCLLVMTPHQIAGEKKNPRQKNRGAHTGGKLRYQVRASGAKNLDLY